MATQLSFGNQECETVTAAPSICSRETVAHNCTRFGHVAPNPVCSCLRGGLARQGLSAERVGHCCSRSQAAPRGGTDGPALGAALPRDAPWPGREEQVDCPFTWNQGAVG